MGDLERLHRLPYPWPGLHPAVLLPHLLRHPPDPQGEPGRPLLQREVPGGLEGVQEEGPVSLRAVLVLSISVASECEAERGVLPASSVAVFVAGGKVAAAPPPAAIGW